MLQNKNYARTEMHQGKGPSIKDVPKIMPTFEPPPSNVRTSFMERTLKGLERYEALKSVLFDFSFNTFLFFQKPNLVDQNLLQ